MSRITLENGTLRATFDTVGGEPVSLGIRTGNGGYDEVLWNGDEKFWDEHAPLLFPTVGRLRGGKWICRGEERELGLHGFARFLRAARVAPGDNCVTFTFRGNEDTARSYPFDFLLTRSFRLEGNALLSSVTVENRDVVPMPFSLGLHPGFMMPGKRSVLELEYREPPRRMTLSDRYFMSGETEPYALRDGKYIDLDNSLFDHDAVILTGVVSATLRSADPSDDARKIRVTCPDAFVFGFWQPAHSDAPFVCIEPWRGFPSFEASDDEPYDDAMTRRGMTVLAPGEKYVYNCKTEIE